MKQLFTLLIGLLLCSVSAQAQGYVNTLITPPEGMTTTTMTVKMTSSDFYGQTDNVTSTLTVGNADGHVYIKGFYEEFPDAWIVGTSDEAKSKITFKQGQYIGLYYGVLDAYSSGYFGDVAKRCDFVLERNASTGIMTNASTSSLGGYYYDDMSTSTNKYSPIARYTSITITPSSPWEPVAPGNEPVGPVTPKEPVVVPEGVTFVPYTLTANSYLAGGTRVTHSASLGFDGDDVYLKDFCRASEQTHTCAKGRREGTRLIFPKGQYIVKFQGQYDMYLYGAIYYFGGQDIYLDDLTFDYNATTNTYTASNGILMSIGEYDGVTGQPNEFLQNVVMQGSLTGVKINDNDNVNLNYYDLQGRSYARQLQKGLFIQGGRKLLAK